MNQICKRLCDSQNVSVAKDLKCHRMQQFFPEDSMHTPEGRPGTGLCRAVHSCLEEMLGSAISDPDSVQGSLQGQRGRFLPPGAVLSGHQKICE